jgi:hypothetical protein
MTRGEDFREVIFPTCANLNARLKTEENEIFSCNIIMRITSLSLWLD